jgi:hypothetical protein
MQVDNWDLATRKISDRLDSQQLGVEVYEHSGLHEQPFSELGLALIHLVVILDVHSITSQAMSYQSFMYPPGPQSCEHVVDATNPYTRRASRSSSSWM